MDKARKMLQSKILLWGIMVLGIVPIIWIAFYNRQSADDFAYALYTHQAVLQDESVFKAALHTVDYFMNNWNGLYFSSFMQSLSFGIYGGKFCIWNTIIIILSLVLGIGLLCWVFVTKVAKEKEGNWQLLTGMISVYILQTIVRPEQGIYWYNGAVNYVFMLGFFFMMLAVMVWYIADNEMKHSVMVFIFGIVLTILTVGGHTVIQCLAIGFSFVLTVFCFVKRNKREMVIYFIVSILGFCVNFYSLGSQARFGELQLRYSLFYIIKRTMLATLKNGIQWFTLSLFLIIIAEIVILKKVIKRISNKYKICFWQVCAVVMFTSFVVFCVIFIPTYLMGAVITGRMENIVYIIYVIAAMFNIFVIVCYFYQKIDMYSIVQRMSENQKKSMEIIGAVLVVIGISYVSMFGMGTCINIPYGSNGINALEQIVSGEAKTYAKELDERERYLMEHQGEDVVVDALSCYPDLLYFHDIEIDKDNWKNICYAEYYGLKSIRRLPNAAGE